MSCVRISPNLLNQPIKYFFDLLRSCSGNRSIWNMQWILECLLILIILLLSSFVNFSMFVANRIISWFIFSNMKSILHLKGHTLDFSTQTRIFAPISHFCITSPRQLSMKISPISNCNLKSPLPI